MCAYRYTHAYTFCQKIENDFCTLKTRTMVYIQVSKFAPIKNTGNAADMHFTKCSSP